MPNRFQFNASLWNGDGGLFNLVNVELVTKDALHNNLAGVIRLTPVLDSVLQTIIIPETIYLETTGTVEFQVNTGIEIKYEFEDSDGFVYPLATTVLSAEGNLGLSVRGQAGLATGEQTLQDVTGNFYDLLSLPVVDIKIKSSYSYVNLAGDFIVPLAVGLPINPEDGSVAIQLASTDDLYSPNGNDVKFEINKNQISNPRIGKEAFTIGTGTLKFSASDGSVVVI